MEELSIILINRNDIPAKIKKPIPPINTVSIDISPNIYDNDYHY